MMDETHAPRETEVTMIRKARHFDFDAKPPRKSVAPDNATPPAPSLADEVTVSRAKIRRLYIPAASHYCATCNTYVSYYSDHSGEHPHHVSGTSGGAGICGGAPNGDLNEPRCNNLWNPLTDARIDRKVEDHVAKIIAAPVNAAESDEAKRNAAIAAVCDEHLDTFCSVAEIIALAEARLKADGK